MSNNIRLTFFSAVICLVLLLRPSRAVNVVTNGYEFTIAIADGVQSVNANNQAQFLNNLQTTMNQMSQLLFQVTDYRMYIKTLNVLIPRSWTNPPPNTATTVTYTYVNADMRVEETIMDDDITPVTSARTKNSKPCGQPGEYIILPPSFFLDIAGSTALYGDLAKVLVHEFAHYRYGVYEEYGFRDEAPAKFPYAFTNTKNYVQVTGCNNTEIPGLIANSLGFDNCSLINENDCKFRPDMTATTGPSTSLMFMQFMPTANRFCDSTNHDRTAPNKQNYFCRHRSIKSIMNGRPDFSSQTALPSTTNTNPVVNYLLPAPQTIFIVMDISTHTLTDPTVFNYVKQTLAQWIGTLALASNRAYVGVATMGGSSSSSNGYIGNYLNIAQTPISIQSTTNQQLLINSINALTRGGTGLLLDRAVVDIADILTPFKDQSGAIALLVKLNDATGQATMAVEAEAIHILNSRNIRLVTVEYGINLIAQRSTLLTNGFFFNALSTNYQTIMTNALNQIIDLTKQQRFQTQRIQLGRSAFTATGASAFNGRATIEWRNSGLEVNFFIPTSATGFNIVMRDSTGNNILNMASPQYSQVYASWNGLYNVHTFNIAASATGEWSYQVNTTGSTFSGFVEAIQILPQDAPLYVGGGGRPSGKPIEVEVYTSGNNGVLSMALNQEDVSFLIYASVLKGYSIPNAVSAVVATVLEPNGRTTDVALSDNGNYPDLLNRDGIFSGFYKPPAIAGTNTYRISVRLEGYRRPGTLSQMMQDPYSYSMPIDQGSYCCGGQYTGSATTVSFQRLLPYVASLSVSSANLAQYKPTRILDFAITAAAEDYSSVTLSWTAPANSYGSTDAVSSYRLVYSTSTTTVIDEAGMIPTATTPVSPGDVLAGSLSPQSPGTRQTVTIRLQRSPPYPALYFSMDATSTTGVRSYPAPMIYLTEIISNGSTTITPDLTSPNTSPPTTSLTPTSTSTSTPTTSLTPTSTSTTGVQTTTGPTGTQTVASTTSSTTLSTKPSTLTPPTTPSSSVGQNNVFAVTIIAIITIILLSM